MRLFGLLLILIAFLVPAFGFADLAQRHDAAAIFSQYLGACALIAMAIAQLLATRLAGLEAVFGGMDRIYVLHKWLAIVAVVCVLLHDTIDADIDGIGRETWLTETAETLGEISLYSLLVLATVSVATFVPYHLWKITHKVMGTVFAAGALHFIFILKPFANGDALALYILAFCSAGVLAYIYTLLPIAAYKGWRGYTVTAVEPTGDAVAVTLTPTGRGLRHRAGQFAFVTFDLPDLGEVHPFTISKAPDNAGVVRFTIKALGDYTQAVSRALAQGVQARVSRPFGHFHLDRSPGDQIWIASGVGITPFAAWAPAVGDIDGNVHLFYCVRSRALAPHLRELETLAARHPNFHLHVIESQTAGRLRPEDIAVHIPTGREAVGVAFCGPKDMREAFRHGLARLGFAPRRLRYEEFEIRSGLGLRKLAAWLIARFGAGEPARRRRPA